MEAEFEDQALALIRRYEESENEEIWKDLEDFACDHFETKGKQCPKGFLYLGVAFYKQDDYEKAIKAFDKCINLDKKDAQAHYNLALAHFKVRNYDDCERYLIRCRDLNPKHRYAWNNLAFIYNLFGLYQQCIDTCKLAHEYIDDNLPGVNCHRHWAFALFKSRLPAKAIIQIKVAIDIAPYDAENWVVWGLIMRTVGNYESAKSKFERALMLDPANASAKFELELLADIEKLDKVISSDQMPEINRLRAIKERQEPPEYRRTGVCALAMQTCSIF